MERFLCEYRCLSHSSRTMFQKIIILPDRLRDCVTSMMSFFSFRLSSSRNLTRRETIQYKKNNHTIFAEAHSSNDSFISLSPHLNDRFIHQNRSDSCWCRCITFSTKQTKSTNETRDPNSVAIVSTMKFGRRRLADEGPDMQASLSCHSACTSCSTARIARATPTVKEPGAEGTIPTVVAAADVAP